MKKILLFLLFLLPWFISGLIFPLNSTYYDSLVVPIFTPPNWFFGIIWPLIYVLSAVNLYQVSRKFKKEYLKDYYKPFLVNFISNSLFMFFFMCLKNNFLAFIDSVIVFISLLFVYYENKSLDKNSSKLLIPYLIWSFIAIILSLSIYFLNI